MCQRKNSKTVPYPGLLQPLEIPNQAWRDRCMDPTYIRRKDTIMVLVDRLTKYIHFIPLAHPLAASRLLSYF